MKATYVITEYNGRKTGFLFEESRLMKTCFLCNESLIGNVYVAKVVNIVKSINAAFVDAGTGDYLYYPLADNDGHHLYTKHGKTDKICVGDEILVQIKKDPIKSKKGEAGSDLEFKGKYMILNRSGEVGVSKKIENSDEKTALKESVEKRLQTFQSEEESENTLNAGVIIRTSAAGAELKDVIDELNELLILMNDLVKKAGHSVCRKCIYENTTGVYDEITDLIIKNKYDDFKIITDDQEVYSEISTKVSDIKTDTVKLYEDQMISLSKLYSIETKLVNGFNKYIYLKSGGTIVVEPTEAMTVIDVNTGKAIKGKNTEDTFLKINKEACTEIARILRLRNLSGIIMIDFINMKKSESIHELIEFLKSEIDKDEIRVTYVDITALGLVELTRKKQVKPLVLKDFM
ncbi:MAG: ribonuclease E/G [Eubacterium sp.]|nr:ribonuclease E/G [Eubacterium sp.]